MPISAPTRPLGSPSSTPTRAWRRTRGLLLALLLAASIPQAAPAGEPKPSAPAAAKSQVVTYKSCRASTGSCALLFTDEKGAEVEVGVMTKAQRVGSPPDFVHVKFPEAMIKRQRNSASDANPAFVGKKFLLLFDASGVVTEVRLAPTTR